MPQRSYSCHEREHGRTRSGPPARCPGWPWISIDLRGCSLAEGHEGPHRVDATCGCWWDSLDGIHGEAVRCRFHEAEDLRIALANERARY